MIYVIGPKDPRVKHAINTTSRSKIWSKGLSPFCLGPVTLSGAKNLIAQNVENAWQFTKVYAEHLNDEGLPSSAYFKWAKQGFSDTRAHRYPMGKGRKPEYSWWNGEKLSYVEARRKIYIPLYSQAVSQTPEYQQLEKKYNQSEDLWLWDFDGWNRGKMSWDEVIDGEDRKMGHAFVLAMMLEGFLDKKITPFSCGTQFGEWQMYNCDYCTKFDNDNPENTNCEIDEALVLGYITGEISNKIAQRMAYDPSAYIWRCGEYEERVDV